MTIYIYIILLLWDTETGLLTQVATSSLFNERIYVKRTKTQNIEQDM